jgi:Flp pilus assembly protein TadG
MRTYVAISERLGSERGTQMVELAVLLPFLVLVLLGSTDFARASYYAITVTNAARSGAQYAAHNAVSAINTAGIRAAAEFEAQNIGSITVASSIFCKCPGGTAPVSCTVGTCGGGAARELYTSVTATRTFETLFDYPVIPSEIAISRNATMRVQ